jgi:ribonucleoside-diphosphate reductase alpha chain
MQAAVQKFTESAVSKTVNLSKTATQFDVSTVYKLAHELGCKGVTVYRDGSREDQVMSSVNTETPEEEEESEAEEVTITQVREALGLNEPRPYCLDAFVFKRKLDMDGKLQNVYVIVGMHENRPYELFIQGNVRAVSPTMAQFIDTVTRMTSLPLRWGVPIESIIEQLEKTPEQHMYSLPHKIADVLKEFLPPSDNEIGMSEDPEELTDDFPRDMTDSNACGCPVCHEGHLVMQEGCMHCNSCGWSGCG